MFAIILWHSCISILFFVETRCCDAIISLMLAFLFLFLPKGSCLLELLSKADWCCLSFSFEYLWFFCVVCHCEWWFIASVLFDHAWHCFSIMLQLLHYCWSIFFYVTKLALLVFHYIICGVVSSHFFSGLWLLLYY